MAQQAAQRRLYRSRDAYLAGVCAGIADFYEFDAIVIRILAILLAPCSLGLAVIVYLVLWFTVPVEPETDGLYDVIPESAESTSFGDVDCLNVAGPTVAPSLKGPSLIVRLVVAVALMLLFMVVATNAAPLLTRASWWQFWPLGFLMIGLCLIVIPVGTKHMTMWHAAGIVLMSASASLLPMSVGVVLWETIPYAFGQLWVFVVVAAVLFGVGLSRGVGSLMVLGALCFAAFCLVGLFMYSIPGDVEVAVLAFQF